MKNAQEKLVEAASTLTTLRAIHEAAKANVQKLEKALKAAENHVEDTRRDWVLLSGEVTQLAERFAEAFDSANSPPAEATSTFNGAGAPASLGVRS